LKIRSFNKGDFRPYKESFQKIDSYKSKTLILDLRDNGGGRLNEIVGFILVSSRLYFCVLDKSEVVSKSSLMEGAYFNGGSFAIKILKALYAPLVCAIYYSLSIKTVRLKLVRFTQDSIS
jgi:hypothetical protein